MPPPLDVFPLAAAPQGAWGRRYVRGGKTASGGLRDYTGFRVFEKPRGTRVFGDLRPKPRRDFEMQARYYLPMYGRFGSPDPALDQHFQDTQSWNIYSYVRNNPIQNVDPTGMLVFFTDKAAFDKYYKAMLTALPKDERKNFTCTTASDGKRFVGYNLPMQKAGGKAPEHSEEMKRMMTVIDSSVVFRFDGGKPTSGATGEIRQPEGGNGAELPSNIRPVGVQDVKIKDLGVSDSVKVKSSESGEITAGQAKSKVIAHELLGHGYLYLSGQSYQHAYKGGTAAADQDIKYIENNALYNSNTQ